VAEEHRVRYRITAEGMLDANRVHLARFWRIYRLVFMVTAVIGLTLAIVVNVTIGVTVLVLALLMLALTWFHGIDTWLLRRSGRGYIGETTEYLIDDEGIRYAGPLGNGLLPWSRITSVRADKKSIAFGRDRILAAWVPSDAFDTPAERDAFIAFVRTHVARQGHIDESSKG
jgi:hypothetical protein